MVDVLMDAELCAWKDEAEKSEQADVIRIHSRLAYGSVRRFS